MIPRDVAELMQQALREGVSVADLKWLLERIIRELTEATP